MKKWRPWLRKQHDQGHRVPEGVLSARNEKGSTGVEKTNSTGEGDGK